MDLLEIEKKWQKKWAEDRIYSFDTSRRDKKYYTLEMFSYPSGAKLHVGHWYNFGPSDSFARFKSMQGYEVFEPMGFDAFGLPAENYAIKTGIHPQDSTLKNIATMEKQLQAWALVNPRISNAEYVKYSFPSKTLECMASGTPLLTTRLAGMPKDYYPYVYLFEDETQEGFVKSLRKVFALSAEELHEFGVAAKAFAIEQKNNISQAQKFYDFLKTIHR